MSKPPVRPRTGEGWTSISCLQVAKKSGDVLFEPTGAPLSPKKERKLVTVELRFLKVFFLARG